MRALIAVLGGDGIGPEVTAEAVKVLRAVASRFGHEFEFAEAAFGGAAMDAHADPLPPRTLELCRRADAVLLGAVGGPEWSGPIRPEQGLLRLRKELGLFANIRPVKVHPELLHASPIRPERLEGVDIIVVRELTGGIYFGPKHTAGGIARDVCEYSETEIARLMRVACGIAMTRTRRVCSVDKANVLETSRLWRAVAERIVRKEFPEIRLEHQLVDSAAMRLITQPATFDVIATENMFGDILTDEAAALVGSIGMLPSASLGEGRRGLYEPIHGSAPDIAGRGIANPCGAILSAALLLRLSLGLREEADAAENGVRRSLESGVRSIDLGPGAPPASTRAVGDHVAAAILSAR